MGQGRALVGDVVVRVGSIRGEFPSSSTTCFSPLPYATFITARTYFKNRHELLTDLSLFTRSARRDVEINRDAPPFLRTR